MAVCFEKSTQIRYNTRWFKRKYIWKLFEKAEIAKFSREEYQSYEYSVKYYRDLKNSIDYAKEEGKIEDAVKMLEKGLEVALIAEITELTEQEIKKIQT